MIKPEFPIIPIFDFQIDLLGEFPWHDEYYYSRDLVWYDNYINGKRFLDSNGRIFIAREKIKLDGFWSKLGFGKQYRVVYQHIGEVWSFDATQKFLYSLAQQVEPELGRNELIAGINQAKTIKQLIQIM